MAFIDYYKILGVSKDIPQDEVRAAYRKRAKQFHPDLHPDDPKAKAKFQALSEAYDVISDPEKRRKYDQYGEHWREAGASGQGGDGSGGFQWNSAEGSPFDNFDFSGFEGRRIFELLPGPFRKYGRPQQVAPQPENVCWFGRNGRQC